MRYESDVVASKRPLTVVIVYDEDIVIEETLIISQGTTQYTYRSAVYLTIFGLV